MASTSMKISPREKLRARYAGSVLAPIIDEDARHSGEGAASRIEGGLRSCYARAMRGKAIRIIGIDPGLRRTGWGVIDSDGVRLVFVACGSFVSDDGESLGHRLRQLFDGLSEVLTKLSPREAAIEQTFVNRDAAATLKLGQARGIAMLAPAMLGLSIAEYAPNAVKKTVVGAGHGGKGQIRAMVKCLLPRAAPDSADAADALAIAITHAHSRSWTEIEARVAVARVRALP
jgi:crossover junction endodeoxyribonuclease RuvC